MYTRGRKHLQPLRGWNRKLVRVLHGKAGGATYRAIKFVLLHREGGEIGIVVLKTWASRTLSGCLNSKVGVVTARLGTSYLIRYRVCCQGNRIVFQWVFKPMGVKQEPWTIALEVMYPKRFVSFRLLFKEKFHLWDCRPISGNI